MDKPAVASDASIREATIVFTRRKRRGPSPWLATGTIGGASLGGAFAPIRMKAGDDLIGAAWAIGGALLGLGVGILLDISRNRR